MQNVGETDFAKQFYAQLGRDSYYQEEDNSPIQNPDELCFDPLAGLTQDDQVHVSVDSLRALDDHEYSVGAVCIEDQHQPQNPTLPEMSREEEDELLGQLVAQLDMVSDQDVPIEGTDEAFEAFLDDLFARYLQDDQPHVSVDVLRGLDSEDSSTTLPVVLVGQPVVVEDHQHQLDPHAVVVPAHQDVQFGPPVILEVQPQQQQEEEEVVGPVVLPPPEPQTDDLVEIIRIIEQQPTKDVQIPQDDVGVIREPRRGYDIKVDRGGHARHDMECQRFRYIVDTGIPEYRRRNKLGKTQLAWQYTNYFLHVMGVKFLKRNKGEQVWRVIPNGDARKKVTQRLRGNRDPVYIAAKRQRFVDKHTGR